MTPANAYAESTPKTRVRKNAFAMPCRKMKMNNGYNFDAELIVSCCCLGKLLCLQPFQLLQRHATVFKLVGSL